MSSKAPDTAMPPTHHGAALDGAWHLPDTWHLPLVGASSDGWYLNLTLTGGGATFFVFGHHWIRNQAVVADRFTVLEHSSERVVHVQDVGPDVADAVGERAGDGVTFRGRHMTMRSGSSSITLGLEADDCVAELELTWDAVLPNWGSGRYPYGTGETFQYSVPRVVASGRISLDGSSYDVAGEGWYDRQSNIYPSTVEMQLTWLGLDLASGHRLSVFETSTNGGPLVTWATIARPDGSLVLARPQSLEASIVDVSPAAVSDATVPTSWQVVIPAVGARLTVTRTSSLAEFDGVHIGVGTATGTIESATTSGRASIDLAGRVRGLQFDPSVTA